MSDIRCDDWRHAPADLRGAAARGRAPAAGSTRCIGTSARASSRSKRRGRAAMPPGLIAHDAAGRVAGWTYYLLAEPPAADWRPRRRSGEVTRQLLDGVLKAPEADMASEVLCFAFPASTSLEGALARRRFEVRKYLYLRKTLSPSAPAAADGAGASPISCGRGREDDARRHRAADGARLRRRARARGRSRRSGTLEEWAHYLAQLIKTPACGALPAGGQPVGAASGRRSPARRGADDGAAARHRARRADRDRSGLSAPRPGAGADAGRAGSAPRPPATGG